MKGIIQSEYSSKDAAFVLEDVSPEEVARAMIEGGRQKEAFYIFDMDQVYQRVQRFRKMMPRVKLFYAIKSHDTDMMLKLIIHLGLGIECATAGEIHKVMSMRVTPRSIIYAMPVKTPEQMTFAHKVGLKHTTFDTSYELKKMKQYWPDAELLIRIRVNGDSTYKLSDKFGCDFETEAVDLLEEAAALELKVVGVAFHVGSPCFSLDSFVLGIRQAKELFEHESKAGRCMKILDMGGGFNGGENGRFEELSILINDALTELFPDPSVQVIAEPGRFVCDSSCTFYCNIYNIRRVLKENKPINMIYLGDGAFGTLRFPEKWYRIEKFKRQTADRDDGKLEEAILWGPSADSADQVMPEFTIRLPRLTPLDWLVFHTQGAYTFSYSTRFARTEPPRMRSVISAGLWEKLKSSQIGVFNDSDFILDPDVSEPLPSNLPAVVSANEKEVYQNTEVLVI